MKKSPEAEYTPFWLMPVEQLHRHINVLERIVELRASLQEDAPRRWLPKAAPRKLQAAPPTTKTVIHRAPMRAPKEGSLRAIIQQALKAHGHPMAREDVAEGVAQLRQIPVTAKLRDKVSQALANRHDPFFARTEDGLYVLNEEAAHVP